MLTVKEINEQPEKLRMVSENYFELAKNAYDFLQKTRPSEMDFVGCGTSYNLAMGLAYQFNRLSDETIPAHFFSGSEVAFGLRRPKKDGILIGLSRSGESTETILALKRARETLGMKTMGITCEKNSTLTRVSDVSVILDFVDEKSVVMTQSFTTMAFFMSSLIRQLVNSKSLEDYLKTIPHLSQKILNDANEFFNAFEFSKIQHFVFLGYDEYLASSLEGVTKVTETSLSEVEAYQSLEYRHGPKSKVSEKSLICLLANEILYEEERKMAQEIKALGGKVINISTKKMEKMDNLVISYEFNDFGDWFLRTIPLQIIGVKKAVDKGLDPDKPKNLTRVVKL